MKILQINKFLYPKGGDAVVALSTGRLFSSKGHNVLFFGMHHPLNPEYPLSEYFINNVDFNTKQSNGKQLRMAFNTIYSLEAKKKVGILVKQSKPDIVHLHNIAHQISPSILHVFKKYRIPVVMTMHDYKLVCPVYTLLANGRICDKCKNKRFFHCFFNKCAKNSYAKSALNTLEMYLHHNILNIYSLIDIFISPSLFLKDKLLAMGFTKKIVHLPNFINISEYIPQYSSDNRTITYVGRLSREKGVNTLIEAVKGLDITLQIIGDGPLRQNIEEKIKNSSISNVKILGYKHRLELNNLMLASMFIMVPSEWHENGPRSIIEAFALGKPVIGARIGGIPELVKDNVTGYTFAPGNADDLREKIIMMINSPDGVRRMGKNARDLVENDLNEEKYYKDLMEVYEEAIDRKG